MKVYCVTIETYVSWNLMVSWRNQSRVRPAKWAAERSRGTPHCSRPQLGLTGWHRRNPCYIVVFFTFIMGHGNSNKLYITHAEHSGMFGQHTASSAGFRAYVHDILLVLCATDGFRITENRKALILLPLLHLTAALFLSNHFRIPFVLATQMGQGVSSS